MIDSRTAPAAAPRHLPRRQLAIGCLLLAIAVGACTGPKKDSPPRSAGRTPVGTDVASGVSDDAATEITTSYLRFFDPTVAEADRLNLIQDGAAFSQAISQQQRSEFAQAVSVKVTKVTVNSADRATVVFTLLVDGSPALPNQAGYAVHENGAWKVAGATFCRVLSTQGAPPPVCTTAPATTLPG